MITKYQTKSESTQAIIKLNAEIEILENSIDKINQRIFIISEVREKLPEYISGKNTSITEHTQAGKQELIPGIPDRTVPQEKIKSRLGVKIKDEPMEELKRAAIGPEQFKLF